MPADVVPQLVHAILWRRGVQTILSKPAVEPGHVSLRERIAAMQASFDTSDEVEQ